MPDSPAFGWAEFRALESFSVLYDIALDEGDFNKWCRVDVTDATDLAGLIFTQGNRRKSKASWEQSGDSYELLPHDGALPGHVLELTIAKNATRHLNGWARDASSVSALFRTPVAKKTDSGPLVVLWRQLLFAKLSRALLQEQGKTAALDCLDPLGLALMKVMPASSRSLGRSSSEAEIQSFLLNILFLNEAAACYRGYHSIAHADDCLRLIRDTVGDGQCPYELVALFNKALGLLHVRNHSDALEGFQALVRYFKDPANKYFEKSHSPPQSRVRWPDQKRLFELYLLNPAVLLQAETLINLQRSDEAKELLEGPNLAPSSTHQKLRRQILLERIDNDTWIGGGSRPKWQQWPKSMNEASHSISLQKIAVEAERALIELRYETAVLLSPPGDDADKLGDGCRRVADAVDRVAEKTKARFEPARDDRSETDQALKSWVDGLGDCMAIVKSVSSRLKPITTPFPLGGSENESRKRQRAALVQGLPPVCESIESFIALKMPNSTNFVREAALDLTVDRGYRDYQVETRKKLAAHAYCLAMCSRELADSIGPDESFKTLELKSRELGLTVLKRIVDEASEPNFKNPPPQYQMVRWQEQVAILKKETLPILVDAGPAELHKALRQFLAKNYLEPVKPYRPDGNCDLCPEVKCITGDAASCSTAALALHGNPAFKMTGEGSTGQKRVESHHYDRILEQNRRAIQERLYQQTEHSVPSGWGFAVLRRWNSYTPALAQSAGGGYFLYHVGEPAARTDAGSSPSRVAQSGVIDIGVVVDPGYGFLRNFFAEGFGVRDITAIVVTHDHPDHLVDFEPIVNLLIEAGKNRSGSNLSASPRGRGVDGKVDALLSPGAFERLEAVVERARSRFRNTRVLSGRKSEEITLGKSKSGALKVQARPAVHKDASESFGRHGQDSIGVIFSIEESGSKRVLALPSDTKWTFEVAEGYLGKGSPDPDLVYLHLGSIAPEDFRLLDYYSSDKTGRSVVGDKWHLYLPGVLWLIDKAGKRLRDLEDGPRLVVLSEFGEEMSRGLRIDLARRLNSYAKDKYPGRVVVVPGDVGMLVDPLRREIRCSCCEEFFAWRTAMSLEACGDSEQIFYVCPECERTLSPNQRHATYAARQASLLSLATHRT